MWPIRNAGARNASVSRKRRQPVAFGVFLGRAGLVPKRLRLISYLWRHISFNESETLPCRIHGKSSGRIGQQDLRFVRRGVSYCSAVARGFLALPSPSLGVSSLDLGRSRKVSGPFLFALRHLARRQPVAGTYSAAAR